jgi:pyruvate/2-oxoglutarate dehydrogenase complex dihydrolipoamide acyltransferase (E2) component
MANESTTQRRQPEKDQLPIEKDQPPKRPPETAKPSGKPKSAKPKDRGEKAIESEKPDKKKQETLLEFQVPADLIGEMKIEIWDGHGRKRVGAIGKDEKRKIDKHGKASFPVSPGAYVVRYFVNGKLKDWQAVQADAKES